MRTSGWSGDPVATALGTSAVAKKLAPRTSTGQCQR